jgi:hypothetical protein
MDITAFAEITYRVLEKTPLSEFLPTLCLPARRQILSLSGVPKDEADVRQVALDWAESKTETDEEFLVAFRDSEHHFRIVRRADGSIDDALYPERKPA